MTPLQQLLRKLTRTGRWPLPEERPILKKLRTWQAFRDTNRDQLRQVAGWPRGVKRQYKADSLPERIAKAWANYLYGEAPEITPAHEDDQPALEALEGASELAAELHRGEDICASEGEVWWRIYADRTVAAHPLIEFHSRGDVVPLYAGPRRLIAVAFVSVLTGSVTGNVAAGGTVWRHFEIHTDGAVDNVLFRGTPSTIGQEVPLTAHAETADLLETWTHGVPGMLAGRITNGELGRNPQLGVSEFEPIADQLLDLNEAQTIGGENMRLTAKKRVVVPQSALRARPLDPQGAGETIDNGDGTRSPAPAAFDAGEDVLVADPLERELGKESNPFQVLEYTFDAEPLVLWKRDLIETALTRRGITPQWIGVTTNDNQGYAPSGTQLRLRLVPTDAAGGEKRRPWAQTLPAVLERMILLDSMAEDRGGFGWPWTDPSAPAFEFGDPLPEDPVEADTRHTLLVGAGIESVQAAVRERHPDWDDDQVQAEIDAIRADRQASAPALFGASGPPAA